MLGSKSDVKDVFSVLQHPGSVRSSHVFKCFPHVSMGIIKYRGAEIGKNVSPRISFRESTVLIRKYLLEIF